MSFFPSSEYRLLILCSRENEDKSFMVTAYDRYRVKNMILFQTEAIKAYLKNHFHVAGKTAAELDPER